MSTAKRATVTTVKGANERAVTVGREENHVIVRPSWGCAMAERTFSPDDARALVLTIEIVARYGARVWVESQDSQGCAFAVQVVDGQATLAESSRDHPDQAGVVPWPALRRALLARAK